MATPVQGDTILSPSGTFRVGIDRLGNLFDPAASVPGPDPIGGSGLGFRRLSDGFDPIKPGTAIEGWGVSAGAVAGFVDPQLRGISNIVANGLPTFTPTMAVISANLVSATNPLLRIDQVFSFVADNVLKIATTVTNVSSASQSVLFRRKVDWDLGPVADLPFSESITSPAITPPVTGAGFGALEEASPLVAFLRAVPPGGGTFGPDDLGAAIQVALGTLAPGASVALDIFHAISQVGQSEASLRSQVQALAGTGFVMTGVGFSAVVPGPFNSAALAIRVGPDQQPPGVIPERPSLTLLGVGLLGLLSYRVRRRLWLA
jgi:hypothetical protein